MSKFLLLFGVIALFWAAVQSTDVCENNKCYNGAVCVTSITRPRDDYTCECRPGWEGEFCDEGTDYDTQNREGVPLIEGRATYAFAASSKLSVKYGPDHSTLYSMTSWIAGYSEKYSVNNDANMVDAPRYTFQGYESEPWIEVQFDMERQMHRVVTQGSPVKPYWITSYKIMHSTDYESWFVMYDVATEQEQLFVGNTDQNTPVSNHVPGHRHALYVRLYPVTYHNQIALRWEIYGCVAQLTTTTSTTTTITTTTEREEREMKGLAVRLHVTSYLCLMSAIISLVINTIY